MAREGYQMFDSDTYVGPAAEILAMYASDYPHRENWFPQSVETVLGWALPSTVKRKLFWDNAVKFYARYGHA